MGSFSAQVEYVFCSLGSAAPAEPSTAEVRKRRRFNCFLDARSVSSCLVTRLEPPRCAPGPLRRSECPEGQDNLVAFMAKHCPDTVVPPPPRAFHHCEVVCRTLRPRTEDRAAVSSDPSMLCRRFKDAPRKYAGRTAQSNSPRPAAA